MIRERSRRHPGVEVLLVGDTLGVIVLLVADTVKCSIIISSSISSSRHHRCNNRRSISSSRHRQVYIKVLVVAHTTQV